MRTVQNPPTPPPAPTPTTTRFRGRAGRNAVLATASRMFLVHGMEAVTIARIAAEAGVTRRAVHQHFASRSALIVAWLREAREPAFSMLGVGLPVVAREADAPHPVDRLIGTLGRALHSPAAGPLELIAALARQSDDADVTALARETTDRWLEWLRGIAQVERAPDPELRARQYLLIVDALLLAGRVHPPDAVVAAARATLEAILREAPAAASADGTGPAPGPR